MLIYIACPYTRGDQAANVRRSMEAYEDILKRGHVPYNPLLSHFHQVVYPHAHDEWMKIDLEIIKRCDGVFRLSGESVGADHEVEFAMGLQLPVWHNILDIPLFR